MNVRDAIAELAAKRPPWDDLLERRVLAGVHREHARRSARRASVRRGGAFAAMLALALGLGAWLSRDRDDVAVTIAAIQTPSSQPAAIEPRAIAAEPAEHDDAQAPGSVLALADGSRVDLEEGARLRTHLQTTTLVHLDHEDGRARYEVKDDLDRTLLVDAGAVRVRVTAAVFVLEVAAERVHVLVESGAVEIEDGQRRIPLVQGERLELAVGRAADEPEVPMRAAAVRSTDRDLDGMLDAADAARRAGRLDEAAGILRRIATMHPTDARTPSVWFMLGRVERRRDRHEAAAHAFRRAGKAAKRGALAEDALAEEATSWNDAGRPTKAAAAAQRYLQRWPAGTHEARVRAIVP